MKRVLNIAIATIALVSLFSINTKADTENIPIRADKEEDIYTLNKDGKDWYLDFNEEFNDDSLDTNKFSDLYLTHWTDEERAKANYYLDGDKIHLMIDQNQAGWRDGTKQQISSIQTGMRDGLHIFDSSLDIGGHHKAVDNYGTKYGYFEIRAKAQRGSGIHSAWWMVGDQGDYKKSSEVDIFEILGKDVGRKSKVWVTIHPWLDKLIGKQSLNYWVDTDISDDFHTYGFEWTKEGMKWYFDGELIRSTTQSPSYKMYTLLGIYQSHGGIFSWVGKLDDSLPYPKEFVVDYFRVYKTREMKENDEVEESEIRALATENKARGAIFGGDFTWDWKHQVGHLGDGDKMSTLQSKDNINFPVNIYADFKEETSLKEMDIYTHYGKGQGITDFILEYSTDGEEFTEVANVENYEWQTNNNEPEKLHLEFEQVDNIKALRLRILKANTLWKHFAINEIEFR